MNYNKVIKDLKERNNKLESQRRQFELNLYHEQHLVEEKDKEIERLKNELSIKSSYIEDVLKTILKSDDFKMQREVYEHGIEYDKKLKGLKENK